MTRDVRHSRRISGDTALWGDVDMLSDFFGTLLVSITLMIGAGAYWILVTGGLPI